MDMSVGMGGDAWLRADMEGLLELLGKRQFSHKTGLMLGIQMYAHLFLVRLSLPTLRGGNSSCSNKFWARLQA